MKSLQISEQITIRTNLSLNRYLRDISKISLVTLDREVELARQIKEGNQDALDELINANLRFVVSVAKQYQNRGLSLPDLINEGNLGLLKAAKRFDETRGFKFISYAVWWIRQGIIQSLSENSRTVRLPLNKIGLMNKINKAVLVFEQGNYREPTVEEIADVIEVSIAEIELCVESSRNCASLDAPLSGESDLNLHSRIKSKTFSNPDSDLLMDSLQADLDDVLNSLTDREADIIRLYYGISGEASRTLSEISSILGLTRERVRQIKQIALERMKVSNRAGLLIKYLGD